MQTTTSNSVQYPCTESTYNGWQNWQTWNIFCQYTSNQTQYYDILEMAREAKDIDYLAAMLQQDYLEGLTDFVDNRFSGRDKDTMSASLIFDAIDISASTIDWRQLAQAFWEDREEIEEL